MTTSTASGREERMEELAAGDRVVRVVPFAGGDVWVRFERPVVPWCERMDPVEEFPFAPAQLAVAVA